MTTSSLPDDLMMEEYDLLQFMDGDDPTAPSTSARSSFSVADAQLQFLHVDDLLSNAAVQLEPPATLKECDTSDLSADASTLLDELLLHGDDLLAHLEEAQEGTTSVSPAPTTTAASPSASVCGTDPASSPMNSPFVNDCPTITTSYFDDPGAMAKLDAATIPTSFQMQRTGSSELGIPSGAASMDGSTTECDESLDGDDSSHSDDLDHTSALLDIVQEEVDEVEEEDDNAEMEEEDDAILHHQQDLLTKEAKYLEAQYDFLVSSSKNSARRASIKAKRQRQREQSQLNKVGGDNALLTQLVAQQQVYTENFKAMLAFAPVNDIRMALMTPIESYIRLGRDFDERRRTILALREEKLDMTYKYIQDKARGIDVNEPYQYSDVFERFGKYYSVHFAISKYEGVEVGQVVKVVYDQMAGKDESIAAAMGCLTIRESYDQIKCNFLHQRIVSSLKWSDEFEEGLPELESNSLFFCRFVGDTAVFATDYIDQDDLHPYQSKDRIRKDVSSGVVLTSHIDADGKHCVIMKKFLMAKFHMYPHNLSEKLTKILFNKMPCVSQKVTKMIDDKLTASKNGPHAHFCKEHAKQEQQAVAAAAAAAAGASVVPPTAST